MELKPGYKLTEVGVIPGDWEVKQIRDVCTLINGRGFKPFEWKESGLPIIRIQNINGSDDFNFYQGSYDKKLEVETNQLLFAWSGSRGTSFGPHVWTGARGLLNYHTWKVQVRNSELDANFFLYALKQLTKFIEDRAHGASALVHTQKWEMEGFEFPVPSNQTEQRAIAAALSDVDTLLTKLDQLITKKRDLKQAVMQQLLTGQTRLPGYSGEWEEKQFFEICQMKSGEGITSADIDDHSKFPCYGGNGLRGFSARYTHDGAYALIGRQGALCGNVLCVTGQFFASEHAIVVTPLKGTDIRWLGVVLTEMNLNQYSESSAQPGLSVSRLLSFASKIPLLAEQTAIATVLSDIDAELTVLEVRREKTRYIKQGMMQELLTGKIRLI